MRQFAEQEIVIPTGPFAGLRFSCARQPFGRLWFDAVDSARWRRTATTGPSQSGKTLTAFVIPTLYHLLEIGETVIVGLPSMDMAGDKWTNDLLPVIQASRYRDLLPRSGAGSRGGKSNLLAVQLFNGATLRFMSGGGDDKSRSHYTGRILVTTETDGLDESSEGSREADKVAQLEARTQSFGDRARIFHECTASLEDGRIWQEITKGTDSRIAIRCPHCRRYVTPEREHLTGWQTAEDELSAGEGARFACPECGEQWTEDERVAANHDCLLVHKGQEITPDGEVTGRPPRTETLGFRWNSANNLLLKTATIGRKEWKAARAADEDNAAREMLQFWWAKPHKPAATSLTALDPYAITKRTRGEPRGRVPAGAAQVTLGIDCGKYLCHWTLIAWLEHATPHVVEYGRFEVPTQEVGEERALLLALRNFRDEIVAKGWPADDGDRSPVLKLVDAGWNQDVVLAFCNESPGYVATKGFGVGQISNGRRVGEKTETGWKVTWAPPGAGYELLEQRDAKLLSVRADQWKTWLHARLQTPVGRPGGLTVHDGGDHLGFAKHLTAEKKVEEFIPGRSVATRWEQVHRNNHYLDSTCLACVAGHAAGERLIGEPEPTEDERAAASPSPGAARNWTTSYKGTY